MLSDTQIRSSRLGVEGKLGLVILAILLLAEVLWSARGPNTEKTDFSLTYVGATILERGQAAQLYDRNTQIQVRDSLFADPNPLLFEHPPFEALLLSPLAKLPYRNAYLLWGVLNTAILLLLVVTLRPYCPWPTQDLVYVCLWPLFAPLGVALFQGQPSIIALAGYSAAYIQLKNQKDFYAGAGFGLALFRFQLALPFVVILLLRRKWRFMGGFACSAGLLTLLSVLAVGFRGIEQYARFLGAVGTNPQDQSYGSAVDMGSIYGLLYALLGEVVSPPVLIAMVVTLSLALLWYIAKKWTRADAASSRSLVFVAAVGASLTVGGHVFTHDFSPLMLAMLVAGGVFFTENLAKQARSLGIAMRVVLVMLWSFPLYFVLVALHGLFLLCPIVLLFAFSALVGAKYVNSYAGRASALATAS